MQQDVLEKLFGKKVRASAASDSGAGGSAGAGGRKKKKAEVTSVLDGKTQQNLGIMVARLRMPTAAVKTMVRAGTRTKHSAAAPAHRVLRHESLHLGAAQVLSLNPAQLTKEKVSVLLRMAPGAADQEALNEYEGDKYA